MRSSLARIVLVLLLSLGGPLAAQTSPSTSADIGNLGVVMALGYAGFPQGAAVVDGEDALLVIGESAQGEDLNGDGDQTDYVYHSLDTELRTLRNLELAAAKTSSGFGFSYVDSTYVLQGGVAAFTIAESRQGAIDLNGDGDTSDDVWAFLDAASGQLTLSRRADVTYGWGAPASGGRWTLFQVDEGNQFGTDLTGDGDALDYVAHVFDRATRRFRNLGLPDAAHGISADGNWYWISVPESEAGADLNGDADLLDSVLHVGTTATWTTRNLGLAAYAAELGGSSLAFTVVEAEQGGSDANGDGDADDAVVYVFDFRTGTTANLALAAAEVLYVPRSAAGDSYALLVDEARQGGQDLNGDGDAVDRVLHVVDTTPLGVVNVGMAGTTQWLTSTFGFDWAAEADTLAFTVLEFAQGGLDLTGDGEVGDMVVHTLDLTTTTLTNHGLALDCMDPVAIWPCGGNEGDLFLASGLLAVGVSEQAMQQDLDGDGLVDINTGIVHHVIDLATGASHNLRAKAGISAWDAPVYTVTGRTVVAVSSLAGLLDVVLFDPDSGCIGAPGLAAYYSTVNDLVRPQLGDGFVLFQRSEATTGSDLNGDGDLLDYGNLIHDVSPMSGGPCAQPF